MSENGFERDERLGSVLEQLSAQLRMSLGNIHTALERLAPPDARDGDGRLDRDAAVLRRSWRRSSAPSPCETTTWWSWSGTW